MSTEGQGHFLTLAQGRVHTKIQTGFSQKLLCRSEPNFYESFQVQGNEKLMTWCWSCDQDGCHAHIWYKPFKNLLLRNRQADFHETWYVALWTPAHHSLFKMMTLRVTLTYFSARSKLVTEAFLWEKVKNVNFSETNVACDLKVGRCRQLIKIMKVCEY